MNQAPARFSFADQLPAKPADDLSIRLSFDHYQEIAQARVDDQEKIKNARIYIELQHQTEQRLEAELRDLTATIDRLRADRGELLTALREIHETAPDYNPSDRVYTDVEARGFDKAAWDAGTIARQAIERVGASLHVDIPRRRAS